MIKRPNTIKMHRLLQELAEVDPRSAKQVRELQLDSRRLLGLVVEQPVEQPASRKAKSRK